MRPARSPTKSPESLDYGKEVLLADGEPETYIVVMIVIRFSDVELKRRALGCMAGRFSFKSLATGEVIVPESALSFLAVEGIAFTVEGPATYEQNAPPLRTAAAPTIQ